MSIYGNPIIIGGSNNGESVPVDDRTLLANWDFTGTDPLIDKVSGKVLENNNNAVTFSAQGAYFTPNVNVEQGLGQYQRLMISKADLLGDGELYGCDIEVDVGSFHKTEWASSNAVRFIMTNQADGFCGQQTSTISSRGWSFYSGSNWSTKHNRTPSFENCTVKISVATENTLDIAYIDGLAFVGNDRESIAPAMQWLALGNSQATCIGGIYIKAMRVYRRKS